MLMALALLALLALLPLTARAATTTTISDQASCQAAGGIWLAPINECDLVFSYTIAAGDTLIVQADTDFSGLTNSGTLILRNFSTVDGNFTNNTSGVINIES